MRLGKLFVASVLMGAVVLLGNWASLAECGGLDNCTIEASCCEACNHCEANKACTCTYTCGGGVSSCSCSCDEAGSVSNLVPDLDAAVDMDVSGSGFSVGGPGNIEIADLAELLEGGFNWKVEVDSTIEDDTVAQGSWSGTLEEALQDYAIDQGIEVTIDDDETTITFSRL